MVETFADILAVGGKSNSLGRADEVITIVLNDPSRLDELYNCLFKEDAWLRMRAVDSLEKICRMHPEWLEPYVDRFSSELAISTQPSIQWHLAQMYREIRLTTKQREFALNWLKNLLSTTNVDWIVSANSMETLAHYTRDGFFSHSELIILLKIQQQHKSNAIVKRATKFLDEFTANS